MTFISVKGHSTLHTMFQKWTFHGMITLWHWHCWLPVEAGVLHRYKKITYETCNYYTPIQVGACIVLNDTNRVLSVGYNGFPDNDLTSSTNEDGINLFMP